MTDIKPNHGHWEVYVDGKFYCSADNEKEAEMELKNYLQGRDVNEA